MDYIAVDTVLIFGRCAIKSTPANISIVNDNVMELTETILIEISEPSIPIDLEQVRGEIRIIDDE